MGCGCGGAKKSVVTAPSGSTAVVRQSSSVITYDVIDQSGTLVASSTNSNLARVEARRTGGTVVPRRTTPAPQ